MGSALATAVGASFTSAAADPSRVASQVVTGIGFIGAGVILKNGGSVKGLTTAATLWVSAGVGIAAGAGLLAPAVIATVLAMVLTLGLRLLKPVTSRGQRTLTVEYEQGHGTIGPLLRRLNALGGSVDRIDVTDDPDSSDRVRNVAIQVTSKQDEEFDEVVEFLRERPEVHQVEVTPGHVS
jgi:putative Mg2+ transporter-C (MgtC) family protein